MYTIFEIYIPCTWIKCLLRFRHTLRRLLFRALNRIWNANIERSPVRRHCKQW